LFGFWARRNEGADDEEVENGERGWESRAWHLPHLSEKARLGKE